MAPDSRKVEVWSPWANGNPRRLLGATYCSLWLLEVDRENWKPSSERQLASCLDDRERARWLSFRFDQDGRLFLQAHAFVRFVLAQFMDCSPAEIGFQFSDNGRPQIAEPLMAHPLHFSLSHTDGLVACLVSTTPECGVDAERVGSLEDLDSLASTVLSPIEWDAWHGLPESERLARFYQHWTLKEAYAKARGHGLNLSPREAGFTGFEEERISLHLSLETGDVPEGWRLQTIKPTTQHQLAWALRPAQDCLMTRCHLDQGTGIFRISADLRAD